MNATTKSAYVIDDTRIEIGANASDEMIISILKVVRHA